MEHPTTIFVPLLDEGITVWRRVSANRLSDGSYLVLPLPCSTAFDEHWQFPPGARVLCETTRLSDGEVLAAVAEVAGNARPTQAATVS